MFREFLNSNPSFTSSYKSKLEILGIISISARDKLLKAPTFSSPISSPRKFGKGGVIRVIHTEPRSCPEFKMSIDLHAWFDGV